MLTLAPPRSRAPANNPALIELEITTTTGDLVEGASGTLDITNEDDGTFAAQGLPIEFNAAAVDTYTYRCIIPNNTFRANARYRGDFTLRASTGETTYGVIPFFGMAVNFLG